MHSETTLPDTLDEALQGRVGQAAIREIAVRPRRYGVADLLTGCLPAGQPCSLELLRTSFKPGRRLTAYYELSWGGDHPGRRHAAVSWSATRTPPSRPPSAADPAATRASYPSLTRLEATSDDGRVRLLLAPADPALPQLSRLTQPEYLAALCEGMTGRRPGSSDRLEPTTLRYRPGQRHVLRVGLPGDRHGVYVKTDRHRSGSKAVAVAEVFRAALQQGCPSTRVCEPAGYSVQDSAALWRTASGRPLRSLLERRSDRRQRAVHVVRGLGTALRVLHAIPAGAGAFQQVAGTAPPDGHAEAAATLRAGEHVAALLPEVGRTYAALVSDLVDALARLPTEPVTLNHGDFKSDNLLVDGARSWILDLDRSGWADPALDLGKFLADVRWWCRDGDAEALCSAFRHGYGAADPARWARADLLAGLFRLKFAARRVPVHGVGWPVEVRRQVGDVARSMREARAS